MVDAQNWLDNITVADPKNKLIKIIHSGGTVVDGTTEVLNPVATDALTGKIQFKDYKNLEEVALDRNKITEIEIINCPKLTEINFSDNDNVKKLDVEKAVVVNGNGSSNLLRDIRISTSVDGGTGGFNELNLKNCKSLEELNISDLGAIKIIKGAKDFDDPIKSINMSGSQGFHVTTTDELERLEEVEKVVEKVLGGSLPTKTDPSTGKQVIDDSKLENNVKAAANPQASADKEQAQKDSKKAKDKLGEVEAERDQLKQQWESIRKELGLGNAATQEQIIVRIKELKGRPTTPCTHTDYDSIKSERDSLKTEVESKKQKISELENANKENTNTNVITKKVLVEKTGDNWENWGIKLSDEQKNKIQNASSAADVENARNEIIKSEFNRLKGKNDNSTILNVGFGVLAIGSLVILGWVLMKQNSSLPQVEPKKEKDK